MSGRMLTLLDSLLDSFIFLSPLANIESGFPLNSFYISDLADPFSDG